MIMIMILIMMMILMKKPGQERLLSPNFVSGLPFSGAAPSVYRLPDGFRTNIIIFVDVP